MPNSIRMSLQMLGEIVHVNREAKGLRQEDLVKRVAPGETRHVISNLELGKRLPKAETLERIAAELNIPEAFWRSFTAPKAKMRCEFEQSLNELIGFDATLNLREESAILAAEDQVQSLFGASMTAQQTLDEFRRLLVFYGIREISRKFFDRYLGPDSFQTIDTFDDSIQKFHRDAIRLFSTFTEAFERMNSNEDLDSILMPLQPRSDDHYRQRRALQLIEPIPEERLSDLGYISAEKVRQEEAERRVLSDFLKELASNLRTDPEALSKIGENRRRRMDSMLRKFNSTLQHGLFSQLFKDDPDKIERESKRLAPKAEGDLQRIAETQGRAKQNLCNYLSADHIDVYVATSMRSEADFISVHRFSNSLFAHADIHPYHLRYFDPTQSWIEDRVAKGLVEALMLRRAHFTIYMAQKTDTFGKDSEASVALGLGRPVIVYVPKLVIPGCEVDSDALANNDRAALERMIHAEGEGPEAEVDASIDDEGLLTRLLTIRLKKINDTDLINAINDHWADFDLASEDARFPDGTKEIYRQWLEEVAKKGAMASPPRADIRDNIIKTLIATVARFERRAKMFREVHPLALQVILSSGVLNGILVVRSVDSCARVLKASIRNELSLDLNIDDFNYRLIERTTRSTIRVISRHKLLQNACKAFFSGRKQNP